MSEVEKIESVPQCELIGSFHTGKCASISGQSTLTYEIGKHRAEGSLHLRITRNTGGGMWCKDWASFEAIEAIVLGAGAQGKELSLFAPWKVHQYRRLRAGGAEGLGVDSTQ